MTHSGVTQCSWNSPAPSAGNIRFYLSRSVSTKQSGLPWNSADYRIWRLMQRIIDTWASTSQNIEVVGQCRKCLCARHHFEHLLNYNTLTTQPPPTVYWGKHVVSFPFHCSYLKANKISKSEGIRTVEYAYLFWKCADVVHQKLSKFVHACRNNSWQKLSHFFETQCRMR